MIRIQFDVDPGMTEEGVTITVCHDAEMAASLWARHTLYDELEAEDHGNNRPSFNPEYFDFDVDYYYKTATQRETIADLVGSESLAGKKLHVFHFPVPVNQDLSLFSKDPEDDLLCGS